MLSRRVQAVSLNLSFFRWIRISETADGVMPSSLAACPSVLGFAAISRCLAGALVDDDLESPR